jgi:predicted metalloendopeptidase
MTRVARRDPNAIYHLHTVASLSKLAPGLDWGEFVAALGVTQPAEINVLNPAFVQAIARAAADAPLPAWRAYLRQHLLDAAAPFLPADFVAARFEYRDRAIRGMQQQPPRVEQVITSITGPFGSEPLAEGLGQLYVARAFSAQDKARAIQMVEDIKAAMRERIAALDWMSAPTKDRALRKLDAMTLKIGYPDRWKPYDGLVIVRDDFAGNWVRANAFDFGVRLGDLGRPVDRARWFASPHLVNGFAGGLNEIVFPAAILQPPFFNPQADEGLTTAASAQSSARDHASLRRPWPAVRRSRQSRRLVDRRGCARLSPARCAGRGAVLGLRAAAGRADQRGADAR